MPKLTIELSTAKYQEIKLLKEVAESPTFKDLVNSGLTLLKWAMLERSRGLKVCAVRQAGDETIIRELEMPALAAAARRADFADALEGVSAPASVANPWAHR